MNVKANEQVISLAKYTLLAMGMISVVGAVFLALGTVAIKAEVAANDDAEQPRHHLSFPELAKDHAYREGCIVYEKD